MTVTFGKKRSHVGSQKSVSLKNNSVSKELKILMRAALNFLGVKSHNGPRILCSPYFSAAAQSLTLHSQNHCVNLSHTHLIHAIAVTSKAVLLLLRELTIT